MKKKLIAILLLYLFQFIGACVNDDYDCDCNGISQIEVEYIGLNVNTQEMVGDNFGETQEINESILKENFLLNINLEFDEKEIVANKQKGHSLSFGFQAAYACSCVQPYLVTKQVERIEILRASPESSNFVDISEAFRILDFFDNVGFFTLDEAIEATRQAENAQNFISNYQLQIADEIAIPEKAVFKIVVGFSDGTELQQETSLITFE